MQLYFKVIKSALLYQKSDTSSILFHTVANEPPQKTEHGSQDLPLMLALDSQTFFSLQMQTFLLVTIACNLWWIHCQRI